MDNSDSWKELRYMLRKLRHRQRRHRDRARSPPRHRRPIEKQCSTLAATHQPSSSPTIYRSSQRSSIALPCSQASPRADVRSSQAPSRTASHRLQSSTLRNHSSSQSRTSSSRSLTSSLASSSSQSLTASSPSSLRTVSPLRSSSSAASSSSPASPQTVSPGPQGSSQTDLPCSHVSSSTNSSCVTRSGGDLKSTGSSYVSPSARLDRGEIISSQPTSYKEEVSINRNHISPRREIDLNISNCAYHLVPENIIKTGIFIIGKHGNENVSLIFPNSQKYLNRKASDDEIYELVIASMKFKESEMLKDKFMNGLKEEIRVKLKLLHSGILAELKDRALIFAVNFEEAGINMDGFDVVWPPWRSKIVSGYQLISMSQITHEQEHPDASFLLQHFEMLNGPSEKASLSLVHINPQVEVKSFHKHFATCEFLCEVKVMYPVLPLTLATLPEVNGMESISTTAATTALDSYTHFFSVVIGHESVQFHDYMIGSSSGSEETRLQLITEPNTEVSLFPSGVVYQCTALSSLVSSSVCIWQYMASGSKRVMGFESRRVALLDIGSPSVLFVIYSPSNSRSLVYSAKASLGVHQNTVKPEGGISYETKEELALCLTRDEQIILMTCSIGCFINSQPVHPEKHVERKDQTAPSDHEEQNNYKDPNNQLVLPPYQILPPFV